MQVVADVADTARLEQLQAFTDAALAHLSLDDLMGTLLERTCQLLGADTCTVLLLEDRELVVRAAFGTKEPLESTRIPAGEGFAGRVAAERRPVVVNDVERSQLVNRALREKGIRSLVGVPLPGAEGILGVMQVGSVDPLHFSDDDVELLELAADRAAIAIEHARLFEAEREARRRIEHVQAVTDAALAHLELEELLAVLLPRIREILGADTCAVLLLDEETNELVARAAVGIEEEVEQGVRIPMGGGFAGRVAAGKAPVILEDVDHADVLNPILREKGIKSMLGVPLLVGGNVTGVLHIGALHYRNFNTRDSELLQLVGDRVALAIERARVHEETVMLDELKLNFVAIASHELRTPATSVYGVLATLVNREGLSEETRQQLLQSGYEQAERLRRLLEELLDLSRLDASAIHLDPRPLVLNRALKKVIADSVPEGTPVQLEVSEDLAAVIDPLVLDRVVSNLLVNAARYGAPPFVVTAERRDRHLRIVVEDAGPGVPEELRPRLFERFARGGQALGSGLGLSIAHAYARAHGGDLIYDPTPTGARFELIVPQR